MLVTMTSRGTVSGVRSYGVVTILNWPGAKMVAYAVTRVILT